MSNHTDAAKIDQCIKTPGKSILTTHLNPDIDSVASNLAMADVLKEHGHDVMIVSQDRVNDYSFLKGFADIVQQNIDDLDWESFDYYWAMDQADFNRSGITRPYPEKLTIINIDHHASNPLWGTLNYVKPKEASTCSILLELFESADITIDPDRATILMAGLAGDTGFFEYSYPHMFETAEKLLSAGADYQTIRFNLNQQYTEEDVRFLGTAIAHLKVYPEKRAVIIAIPYEVMKSYSEEVRAGIATKYIQSIKDTDFGAILTGESPDKVRVGLRSRERSYDVSKIAMSLGGGGHIVAAGASVKGKSMEKVVAEILQLA